MDRFIAAAKWGTAMVGGDLKSNMDRFIVRPAVEVMRINGI